MSKDKLPPEPIITQPTHPEVTGIVGRAVALPVVESGRESKRDAGHLNPDDYEDEQYRQENADIKKGAWERAMEADKRRKNLEPRYL